MKRRREERRQKKKCARSTSPPFFSRRSPHGRLVERPPERVKGDVDGESVRPRLENLADDPFRLSSELDGVGVEGLQPELGDGGLDKDELGLFEDGADLQKKKGKEKEEEEMLRRRKRGKEEEGTGLAVMLHER